MPTQNWLTKNCNRACANRQRLRSSADGEQILLAIEDDGCGFELPARWVDLARAGHLGLVGTIEQAEAVGGKLKIQTAPGIGTLVQVVVPA